MVAETRTEIMEAARGFARAIGESAQFREYEQAAEALREDTAARTLLAEYEGAQQTRQMLQSWSDGNSSHNEQFRELEQKVFQHPKLHKYFESQKRLVTLIQDLNKSLRKDLGFDFARLAKPAGGCC
jgi:cell fate (sporulation/competence/biofilm development) regulator YlbF (YheA/YmcA/DUF963 family)